MRAIVQRVKCASVIIDDTVYASIKHGYLIYLGIKVDDDINITHQLADKIHNLRIFEDDQDKMNLNLDAIGGEILVISQFTLYGSTKGNNRPSFILAAKPEQAILLYEAFIKRLSMYHMVKTGIFGSHMVIQSENDGPVTIQIEL